MPNLAGRCALFGWWLCLIWLGVVPTLAGSCALFGGELGPNLAESWGLFWRRVRPNLAESCASFGWEVCLLWLVSSNGISVIL